jgi:acetyl esterase
MPIDSNETERLPLVLKPDRIWTYKTVEGMELQAHGFLPKDARQGEARAALVFFHPGGWNMGEPAWGYEICGRYAASGMVAISFQYRLSSVGGYTPVDALTDVRSAIRWTRKSAATLGIDSEKVAGCGISAGAHLVLCATMVEGPDSPGDDVAFSSVPNGLALESAVTNPELGTQFLELMQGRYRPEDYSPSYHVRPGLPPMCFIHGTGDDIVPYDSVKGFVARMKETGNRCELHTFEGTDHFFSNMSDKIEALRRIDGFLRGLGYIEEKSNG